MQETGLTGIIPLIYISALWGQHPAFVHPESPEGAQSRGTTLAGGLMALTSFAYCHAACDIPRP